jgi:hypothetical protein
MNNPKLERSPPLDFESIDNKELFRELFNVPLRKDIQPNAGRIQQAGAASYCMVYSPWKHLVEGRYLHSRFALARLAATEGFDADNLHSDVDFASNVDAISAFLRRGELIAFCSGRHEGYFTWRTSISQAKREMDNFVERASRLSRIGQIDAALDLLYDNIDALMTNGDFEQIDSVLRGVELESLSIDILLGLLTSTLPARTKLGSRKEFFVAVEKEIKRRGEWEKGLLTGLES